MMSYSMDDYIDDYYETAMEAERDYDDFIEVAIELYKELQAMHNTVYKKYRELLLWSRRLKSLKGESLNRQFEQWNTEFRHKVYDSLKANELSVVDTPYCFEILPFSTSLLNCNYDNRFSTLVYVLTQQSHGDLFDDVDNLPDVHEYYEKGELTYLEIIQVFYRGWQNLQEIRENKLGIMKDFCEQLREDAKELELRMKNAEREFYLED